MAKPRLITWPELLDFQSRIVGHRQAVRLGAVLSHETAAEVHELIDKPSAKIHITVPASHDPARRGPIRGVTIEVFSATGNRTFMI